MLKPILTAAATVVLLAGCADTWDLEATRAMPAQGDAFTDALKDAYLARAEFERNESDWGDVTYFNMRAKSAAQGTAPAVPELSTRGISGADLVAGRTALIERLQSNAPGNTPKACAEAQAWFEHWMEQEEEGHQPDHIAMAKGSFAEWLEQCEPVVREAEDFAIYFPLDSARLTTAARGEVARAAATYERMDRAVVTIVGHTDTSGSAAYNEDLAQRRAAMVTSALTAMGVPSDAINRDAMGERQPAVETGDGVEEVENRRVTITVAPAPGT
ncbi:OmpA family protein [Caenispirillum salinarum]|uniref:OmpA family protein n=1 Tax=Caenispirillum salinarum TaxID=859058 RepID=UPI00384DDFB8